MSPDDDARLFREVHRGVWARKMNTDGDGYGLFFAKSIAGLYKINLDYYPRELTEKSWPAAPLRWHVFVLYIPMTLVIS